MVFNAKARAKLTMLLVAIEIFIDRKLDAGFEHPLGIGGDQRGRAEPDRIAASVGQTRSAQFILEFELSVHLQEKDDIRIGVFALDRAVADRPIDK